MLPICICEHRFCVTFVADVYNGNRPMAVDLKMATVTSWMYFRDWLLS